MWHLLHRTWILSAFYRRWIKWRDGNVMKNEFSGGVEERDRRGAQEFSSMQGEIVWELCAEQTDRIWSKPLKSVAIRPSVILCLVAGCWWKKLSKTKHRKLAPNRNRWWWHGIKVTSVPLLMVRSESYTFSSTEFTHTWSWRKAFPLKMQYLEDAKNI